MRVYVAFGFLSLNICCATVQAASTSSPIVVSNDLPEGASMVIEDGFISFAIEFPTFPAFAGKMFPQ
jgi:hypothetical protein